MPPTTATGPGPRGAAQGALTPRSLFIGLVLALGCGVAGPFFTLYIQGSNTGGGFYTNPLAHFLLFVMAGLVNILVGSFRRSWALGRGELVAIYILMTLGNQAVSMGHYWVPILSGPYYYATPENNWEELIHPHLADWLAPYQLDSLRGFFEGSRGQAAVAQWTAWIRPLLHWFPMLLALQAASLCLMVILRRQWVERERIIYPLVHVSQAMIQDDPRGSLVKPFFRNPMMWLGFAIPAIIGTLQGLHAYFPFFPELQLRTSVQVYHGVHLPLILSVVAIGFFFLIKLEVAFSLWIFTLLNILQEGIYTNLGFADSREPALSVWNYGLPSLVHQSMGAMILLVFGGLWVSREHLWNVARKAFAGAPDVDDSDEIISYRGAVLGLIASTAAMAFWLWRSGMPPLGILSLLFFAFVVYVALTRVIAEGGVAMLYAPLVPVDAALSALGTAQYGASGIVGLAVARIWANDIFNFAMPHCANGLKLSEEIAGRKRPLFWSMLAAILIGLVGCSAMVLYLGYTYGAINMSRPHFIWLTNYVYDFAAARIETPSGADWPGWLHTGAGGLVMGLMMVAQRLWAWWPLHPIGYPVSSVFSWMGFNAFLAWLLKSVVLKYGGPNAYGTIRPLFLGMIIGQFAMYGLFWILDPITGMVGNRLMQ